MKKIIVFEGIDGSGKTTLINALHQQLTIPHQIHQGLGSSSVGKEIRNLFLNHQSINHHTRFYLSLANMAQVQTELIKSQLKNNQLIILDRWLGSTFAYQLFPFLQTNKRISPLKSVFDIAHETVLVKPDLLIYLDIDPIIGKSRKQNQKDHQEDTIESKPLSYFNDVREGYWRYITNYQTGLNLILNGKNSIQSNVQKIIKIINWLGEI
ncbi:Thymidylate kinase [Candidatus Phytoplasma solani]|nr:Thymidylate kinase [Candidatus Phytoplasma solani]